MLCPLDAARPSSCRARGRPLAAAAGNIALRGNHLIIWTGLLSTHSANNIYSIYYILYEGINGQIAHSYEANALLEGGGGGVRKAAFVHLYDRSSCYLDLLQLILRECLEGVGPLDAFMLFYNILRMNKEQWRKKGRNILFILFCMYGHT